MITHDLRCVACDGEIVDAKHGESFICRDCGKSYLFVLGVPYIGEFDENDIIGLVEIAANLSNRKNFGVTPEEVERWEAVLEEFHNSDNKECLRNNNSIVQSPYFSNRYGEWKEIKTLTQDIDLNGKNVLDIGAGLGWDSHRLHLLGANVTALEYSPLLAESGRENSRISDGLEDFLMYFHLKITCLMQYSVMRHYITCEMSQKLFQKPCGF